MKNFTMVYICVNEGYEIEIHSINARKAGKNCR